MKHPRNRLNLVLVAALSLAATVLAAPPGANLESATKFSSVEYFEAPHQQQMRTRLSGATATPLPGGLVAIQQLKIERFNANGKLDQVVTAPNCVYDTINGTASSPGPLKLQTGDGNYRVTGDGFLWRQSEQSLNISNNVQTVIEAPSEKMNVP